MTDGIFESISQRIGREETQENRRIQEIADELRRRCCVYEKEYGTSSSNVNIALEIKGGWTMKILYQILVIIIKYWYICRKIIMI